MATIKDVARLAGVGLGTASRVVSGKGSVAPATARRVHKAIQQLNFRPSHTARALLSGSSQMIGVYIPILKGTFYTPILHTIDGELRERGRHMVVAFGQGSGDQRRQALEGTEFLIDRGCDGLIVMSNELLEKDIVALGRRQPRFVVLNRIFESIREQCFSVDHVRGGVLAAQALVGHGHRQLAVIAGPATAPDNVARIGGFMDGVRRHGLDPQHIPMLASDFSPEGGWASARALLAGKRRFTGLFCANDEMAVGALSYFQQAGLAVPTDISVVGYDDADSAAYSAPRLTSVHIPLREVTVSGLNCLLNLCYGYSLPVQRDFAVSVTWRASVANAAQPTRTRRQRAAPA
jgi:LacI family transcriptional regulator